MRERIGLKLTLRWSSRREEIHGIFILEKGKHKETAVSACKISNWKVPASVPNDLIFEPKRE